MIRRRGALVLFLGALHVVACNALFDIEVPTIHETSEAGYGGPEAGNGDSAPPDAAPPCNFDAIANHGALDPTFRSGATKTPWAYFEVAGLLIDSSSRIYVFGSGQNAVRDVDDPLGPSGYDFVVARFLANGQLDASYGGSTGFAAIDLRANEGPAAAALDSKGRLVLAGGRVATDDAGVSHEQVAVARLTPDGQIDHTFNRAADALSGYEFLNPPGAPAGLGVYQANALALDGDDILVAGANQNSFNIADSGFAFRLREDGSVDPAFNPVYESGIQGFFGAVASNGVVSLVTSAGTRFLVEQVGRDGARIATFGKAGRATFAVPAAQTVRAGGLLLQPDGKLVAVGGRDSVDNVVVARFLADGTPDVAEFNGGSYSSKTSVWFWQYAHTGIARQCDGKILASGVVGSTMNGIPPAIRVERLHVDGTIDTTFGTDGGVQGEASVEVGAGGGVAVDPRTSYVVAAVRAETRKQIVLYRFLP